MVKQSEVIQGTEKEFLNEFRKLCYSRSSWQVWAEYWWSYEQLEFLTDMDAKRAESTFRKWLKTRDECGVRPAFALLERYQDKVKAMRLAKKHKKETDVIDQEMERFKALPDDYQTFVEETVFKDENYIFYNTDRKELHFGMAWESSPVQRFS